MTCASCVSKIERHIKSLPGVQTVDIGLLTHRGRVKYDPSKIGPRDIIAEITVLKHKNMIYIVFEIHLLESWLSCNTFVRRLQE